MSKEIKRNLIDDTNNLSIYSGGDHEDDSDDDDGVRKLKGEEVDQYTDEERAQLKYTICFRLSVYGVFCFLLFLFIVA